MTLNTEILSQVLLGIEKWAAINGLDIIALEKSASLYIGKNGNERTYWVRPFIK